MDKKLIRIILSSLIFLVGVILQIKIWWVNLIIFLAAYFIVSFKIIIKAFKNIMSCKFFDENLIIKFNLYTILKRYPQIKTKYPQQN